MLTWHMCKPGIVQHVRDPPDSCGIQLSKLNATGSVSNFLSCLVRTRFASFSILAAVEDLLVGTCLLGDR
jgi:hypothetical protein